MNTEPNVSLQIKEKQENKFPTPKCGKNKQKKGKAHISRLGMKRLSYY